MTRRLIYLLVLSLSAWSGGCDRGKEGSATSRPASATQPTAAASAAGFTLPDVDVSGLPFALQTKIGAARTVLRNAGADPQRIGELGALYYAHGFPQAAATCFKRAAELDPTDFGLWYMLGRANDQAGDAPQAAANYNKALAAQATYQKEHPDKPQEPYTPILIRLAALQLEKEPAKAAESLGRVLQAEPDNLAGHYGLGLCSRGQKRLDEAAAHFRRALEIAPNCGPAHAGLAAVLTAQGKTDEAAQHQRAASGSERLLPTDDQLETIVLRKGFHLETLLAAADDFAQRGDFQQAERMLLAARDVDSSKTVVRNAFGLLRLKQGKAEAAVQEFRSLLKDHPDFLPAKSNLAVALMTLGKLDEAEPLLQDQIEKQPDNMQILELFWQLKDKQHKTDDVLPALEKALQAAPDNANVCYMAGVLFARMNKMAEALTAMRKAAELQPDSAPAHYQVGMLLRRGDDMEGARREWTEALRLSPTSVPPRVALVSLLLSDKKYMEAERSLREGLQSTPESPELANSLAWVLATSPDAAQRKGEEAVTWAEKACQASNYAEHATLDTLAAAYAEVGRFEDARKRADEAIKLAQASQNTLAATEYEGRRALYEKDQPYRQPE